MISLERKCLRALYNLKTNNNKQTKKEGKNLTKYIIKQKLDHKIPAKFKIKMEKSKQSTTSLVLSNKYDDDNSTSKKNPQTLL